MNAEHGSEVFVGNFLGESRLIFECPVVAFLSGFCNKIEDAFLHAHVILFDVPEPVRAEKFVFVVEIQPGVRGMVAISVASIAWMFSTAGDCWMKLFNEIT